MKGCDSPAGVWSNIYSRPSFGRMAGIYGVYIGVSRMYGHICEVSSPAPARRDRSSRPWHRMSVFCFLLQYTCVYSLRRAPTDVLFTSSPSPPHHYLLYSSCWCMYCSSSCCSCKKHLAAILGQRSSFHCVNNTALILWITDIALV